MKKTKYTIQTTITFRKELKLIKKRGLNIKNLENVVEMLADGISLPENIATIG